MADTEAHCYGAVHQGENRSSCVTGGFVRCQKGLPLCRKDATVTYDRRGFSRSELDGPQDSKHRLETDADDARRLLEHAFAASDRQFMAGPRDPKHGESIRANVTYWFEHELRQ
jgi:hypothetical protein